MIMGEFGDGLGLCWDGLGWFVTIYTTLFDDLVCF